MANTTSNVIVGAAEFAVGTGTPSTAGVDATFAAVKTAVNTQGGALTKDFRTWVNALASTGQGGTAQGYTTAVNGVYFRDCGLTTAGVEINYNPDFGEVEVDQLLDAARLFKQKINVQVKTSLAEATLENLLYVWDDSTTPTGTATLPVEYGAQGSIGPSVYMKPGTLGEAPQERHLLFVGPGPGGATTAKQRVYIASRAVQVEASSQALKKAEATVFPVSFRLLPDVGSSFSAYGKIVDVI